MEKGVKAYHKQLPLAAPFSKVVCFSCVRMHQHVGKVFKKLSTFDNGWHNFCGDWFDNRHNANRNNNNEKYLHSRF